MEPALLSPERWTHFRALWLQYGERAIDGFREPGNQRRQLPSKPLSYKTMGVWKRAEILLKARREIAPIHELPQKLPPNNLDEAYALQWITTGSWSGKTFASSGSRVEVRFSSFGEVNLKFE